MNAKFSLYLFCLVAPYAMTATCLIDPFERPEISSPYGKYRAAIGATVHQGFDMVSIDKAKPSSKLLKAAAKGKIVFADFRGGGYGNTVAIERQDDMPGDIIFYRHVKYSFPKPKGSIVAVGDLVGYMAGTKFARADKGFADHLHFEYMTKTANAIQYEYDPVTKKIANQFVHKGKKGHGDRFFIGRGLYYTDPAPYFCNTFRFQATVTGAFHFKDTKEQYNFIMTQLGKTGGIAPGTPPNLGEYSGAQQDATARISCAAAYDG